jgi:hypothetical protein
MKIGFVTRSDKVATLIIRSRKQIFTRCCAVVFYYAHTLIRKRKGRE